MKTNTTIYETVAGDLFVEELPQEELYKKVPFKDSVSFIILKRITSQSSEIVETFIHEHKTSTISHIFKIKHDGRYEVIHLVVPTIEWITNHPVGLVPKYFYYEHSLSLARPDNTTQVDMEDVLEDPDLEDRVMGLTRKDIFTVFNLWQCYFNYCKKMLESECSKDTKCLDCNDESSYNKNLIWIFLSAIQYYIHFGEFQSAQELLENISGCNSLCSNKMFSKLYNCGCGK